MTSRFFGELPEYPEGSYFSSRDELSSAGVHRPRQAGISGSEKEGADSIVLSGGYEDDFDAGDTIVYIGHGGRDPDSGQQVSDQLLTRGNLALALSCVHGLPVRVIRGAGHRSPYSPMSGYRYAGLYRVESYWRGPGKSGHNVWRFRLEKLPAVTDPAPTDLGARRVPTTIQRIVRNTQQGQYLKTLYDYRCQVCEIRLAGSSGPYAESAHIRPLGAPHHGEDALSNLLCLCPNHHVLLDFGGFTILDDFSLVGIGSALYVHKKHDLDPANLHYHRSHFYKFI